MPPGCNVYGCPKEVATLIDDISKMDADADLKVGIPCAAG
jgi:hypothetical protein